MTARAGRKGGIASIEAVTGVDSQTFVCVATAREMFGITPVSARELAAALLAVADEAEAIDAAAAARPVQDALFGICAMGVPEAAV